MALKLFNTLSRNKEEFKPLHGNEVGLYTCGMTVYGEPHIGNLRTYIFEDILKRVLLVNGYSVKHVMNITDVGHLTSDADEGEDKMEKGSRLTGMTVWDLAEHYTKIFKNNLSDLNILSPDIWCKATDYIPEQITLIKKLESKGFTYKTADGVYYDSSKFPAYGKLARLDIAGLKEGARIEANPEKRSITDFALWKFSPHDKKRQMEWESPWGKGFPGWHIECSAMSMKHLGETFDIHCGGIDHVPVHHTNEIAQSEAVTGKPLAKYWVHGEHLIVSDKRMGKSEGNLLTLDWLKNQGISPLAYRYFTLQAHYRSKLNFNLEAVQGAQKALQNLYDKIAPEASTTVVCAEFEEKFMMAVNDDLNMPQALAIVWELLKSDYPYHEKKTSLLKFDRILGLGLSRIRPLIIPEKIMQLVALREEARRALDWSQADVIRQKIFDHGFTVNDTDIGPIIKPALR